MGAQRFPGKPLHPIAGVPLVVRVLRQALKSRLADVVLVATDDERIAAVAVGSQIDDLGDYRPGERAVREMRAASPLREAGFSKRDVRALSRRLGLPGSGREAAACLASRIPYGRGIDRAVLRRVERAEGLLRKRGFSSVRVRADGGVARIEVAPTR